MKFICSKCGHSEEVKTRKMTCDCGGLWELDYCAKKFDLELVDGNQWNIFRYREFMPILDDSWRDVSMGEGLTPIVPFNEDLMLKMDYLMPTLSFKDRGAAFLIAHCKSIGVKSIIQDSSGNAGNSIAAYGARAGMDCQIFVPEGTSEEKINMIEAHGAKIKIVEGSRDVCAEECRRKAREENIYYASHVYNPLFYEGTKTYIYEIYEELRRIPKNIFLPLGNGTLFIGVIKGLEELLKSGYIDEMPKIIAIQSENCKPFLEAFVLGSRKILKTKVGATVAEGIAIGEPMRGEEILKYIYKYNVSLITAPEDKILETRDILAKKGIFAEPTAAANLAAYNYYCELNGRTPDSLIPICGAGLKSKK